MKKSEKEGLLSRIRDVYKLANNNPSGALCVLAAIVEDLIQANDTKG